MANVSIMGASYTDVPAVTLPKTGGGTATFYEESGSLPITDNGTYNVTGYASVAVSIPFQTYYTGSSDPASSLGVNGDIYLKT